jgi:hypothetical protein
MPFKTTPSWPARIRLFVDDLPLRRPLGSPPIDPSVRDPEICSIMYQDMITKAFNWVSTLVPRINAMGGECTTLATCLAGKSVSSVYLTCANCVSYPNSFDKDFASNTPSAVGAGSLQLCLSRLGAYLSQGTVNGLVFRELIRLCWGKELDALALYYYFTAVDTSGPFTVYYPVPSVAKDYMCDGGVPLGSSGTVGGYYRAGTYMVWNSYSGTLYSKTSVSPGIAGSGIGTVGLSLTGNLGDPYWRHMCPP